MTKKPLTIHSENIMPIIKKWLYSDKDIFARELVSNACDAIHKVKILSDQGKADANTDEFRIDIRIDKEKKTLKFIDTGLGMDAKEVEKYIAQIAFSSAEEFVEKYKTNTPGDQFIGHFGLGFYSAYMVASKVEIDTLSYKKSAKPCFWSSDGEREYILEKGKRETRGTEITLYIDENSLEFLDEFKIKSILQHYSAFLSYPVYLEDKRINTHEPLWIKNASECTEKDYLDFYRYLYPMEQDPLFWVHLNVDYPFHLKGILYFPKIQQNFDINKNTVKLYCNRVFVSDNCKDVLPNYLMVLQGVIDSPDIPLNVSRSSLQMDNTVRKLSGHISKKVSDSLSTLYRNDKERFLKSWEDVSMIVKLGVLEDDKFYEKVKDFLVWKVVGGDWMTIDQYLEKNRGITKDKVIYTKDEHQLPHFIEIYKNKGIDVIAAPNPIDSYVLQKLESKLAGVKFQRLDGALDDNIIDKSKEKSILDADGKSEAANIADFFRKKLNGSNIEVEAKSLASNECPGFILIDEEKRRMRDYMLTLNSPEVFLEMQKNLKHTFVVNTNHPLITKIQELDKKKPELADKLTQEIYDLALLSQKEMDPKLLNDFIARSTNILTELL